MWSHESGAGSVVHAGSTEWCAGLQQGAEDALVAQAIQQLQIAHVG